MRNLREKIFFKVLKYLYSHSALHLQPSIQARRDALQPHARAWYQYLFLAITMVYASFKSRSFVAFYDIVPFQDVVCVWMGFYLRARLLYHNWKMQWHLSSINHISKAREYFLNSGPPLKSLYIPFAVGWYKPEPEARTDQFGVKCYSDRSI